MCFRHQAINEADIQEHADKLQTYTDMVEETIDLDAMNRHDIILKPELDTELQRLRDELLDVKDGLDAEHVRVAEDLGVDIDKKLHLEKHQVYNYSFRITKAVRRRHSA